MKEKLRQVLRDRQASLTEAQKRGYVFPGRVRERATGLRGDTWWSEALKPIQEAMPIFIDGDLPPERKDIFGLAKSTVESPPVRRVIPIIAAQQAA